MKPIVFFDEETTGTDVCKDRIVQLATLKIFHSLNDEGERKNILINPGIPIPPEATAVHGITDEMVKDSPPFAMYAKGIAAYLSGCDLAGYNIVRFDVPLLAEEFERCGITWPEPGTKYFDACNIFKGKEERTLGAAVQFYCNRAHGEAHDALGDVLATRDVMVAQMRKYEDLADYEAYNKFCTNPKAVDLAGKIELNDAGEPCFAFGKNKGKPVKSDGGYVSWMLGGDFPSSTKKILRQIMGWTNGGEPAKPKRGKK